MIGTLSRKITEHNQLDGKWAEEYKKASDYLFWTEPNFMDNFRTNDNGRIVETQRMNSFNNSLEPIAGTKSPEDGKVCWVLLPSNVDRPSGWFWYIKEEDN